MFDESDLREDLCKFILKNSLNSYNKCFRKKLYRNKTRISCLVHFSSKIMSL